MKDAIEKSGGLADGANSNLLNLAMPVRDGMQIWVPEVQDNQGGVIPSGQSGPDRDVDHPVNLININTASQAELEILSGIGPVIAKAIIQFRLENGPFDEISEIQSVSGIGPATFDKFRLISP